MQKIEQLIQIDGLLGKILKILNSLDNPNLNNRGVDKNYLSLFLELENQKDWLIDKKEQLLNEIKKENKNLYTTLYKKCLQVENNLISELLAARKGVK